MARDITAADASQPEVLASVDSAPGRSEFIIADVTSDDAWLSVREMDAPILSEWC